jgi:phosphohistidine swiveling domain-containing protein
LPEAANGKARTLAEMQRAGFCVPEFVCSPPDLEHAFNALGTPLVVRSSASVEDGGRASFAGLFHSCLNLRSFEEVVRAVDRCQASVAEPAVVEYCRKQGIDPRSVHMDVIVQRMVQPQLAGVAFTVNPVTGADEIVIEACEGLADELLAGRAPALPRDHPLVARYAPEIERVARRLQQHFGAPQDMEFAIEGGTLFVVQSRPITRISFAPEVGEWTNADFRDGGVSCTVCTPLMWSLYDFIWEDALKGFLREIKLFDGDFQAGRMFFGRPYWNLGAVKRCLMKLPGFVEREFDNDLSVQINYEGDGIRTPFTLGGVVRALPTILAIESVWKRQERFDRAFLAAGFDALVKPFEETPAKPEDSLAQLIHNAYRITESNYFRTIYCASLAKLDFKDSFPDADYPALVGGLPPMRHLEPGGEMRAMALRGETDVTPLLDRFRHHSRRELDIRAPRWDEDRAWVEQLLEHSSTADGSDPRRLYEAARSDAIARVPWSKRRAFGRKLDRLRRFIWLREEMRDLSSRIYYLIRRRVLQIAERRGLGDDIFFMTFREILNDDRSTIDRSREIYESYRNFDAPHEISSRFTFAEPAAAGALTGIPASPGAVRGVARVARTVEEAMRLEQGAILVCLFTDPGWTVLLDRAAGVVTETGGLLSHAAVICREYGIPAVLGVPGATRRIPDGSTIAIDGTSGRVDLFTESRLPAAGA